MIGAMNPLFLDLITHFLLALALGTACFSWIADPKLTGAGFMRLIVGHGAIFLGLMIVVNILLAGLPHLLWLSFQLFGLLVLGLQWKFHPDQRSRWMWALYVLQLFATFALYVGFADRGDGELAFFVSSALFLGITHYAMLLGHYYLVVPKLTEKPLLTCMKIFWSLLGLKMLFSAYYTWQALPFLEEGTMLGDGYLFNWLVISMRWLWGYGALTVLSYFAWRLCRMRSIQSATGVLYIMVFFVFVGELLSAYLFLKNGLAI